MRNKETEKQAYISQIAGIKNVINNPPVCRTALRCVKKSDGGTIIFTDSYRIYTLKGDDPSLKHHDESMGSYPFVGKILSRAADKHARAKTIVMIDEDAIRKLKDEYVSINGNPFTRRYLIDMVRIMGKGQSYVLIPEGSSDCMSLSCLNDQGFGYLLGILSYNNNFKEVGIFPKKEIDVNRDNLRKANAIECEILMIDECVNRCKSIITEKGSEIRFKFKDGESSESAFIELTKNEQDEFIKTIIRNRESRKETLLSLFEAL